jgi:hypothetical protein
VSSRGIKGAKGRLTDYGRGGSSGRECEEESKGAHAVEVVRVEVLDDEWARRGRDEDRTHTRRPTPQSYTRRARPSQTYRRLPGIGGTAEDCGQHRWSRDNSQRRSGVTVPKLGPLDVRETEGTARPAYPLRAEYSAQRKCQGQFGVNGS